METGANKILPKVNFSPSSPNNLLTEKCHLSVEIGLSNFRFCLFDTLTFTYILLKEFEFKTDKEFTGNQNKAYINFKNFANSLEILVGLLNPLGFLF